jgi:vitamin B12 transporter
MKSSLLLTTAAIALTAAAAFAEPNSVETVVVSATRTEQPLAVTGASVTVFDSNDLKTQQTVALTDILQETPSLVVVRNGGLGQPASISLRGGEAGQTVVLIDGVRVNDPSTTDDSAAAALGDLLANSIDRVEVLRGPQSTLYGSDAIGGIVNVITRRGGSAPLALNASAEGGSFGTFHANAAANGTVDSLDYGAGVNFLTTTGTSTADSRFGNHENDGYTNFGATVNLREHLSDDVSVDLRAYYTHGHDDFDDGFGGPPLFAVADSAANNTNEIKTGYLALNADLHGIQNRIAVIATEGARSFFDSSSDITHLNYQYFSSTLRFEYQGVVDLDDDKQITFGAETQESTFRNDNFGIFAFFSPPHVLGHDRLTGYYAQAQATLFDDLTLTGGIRLDDDEQFGTHVSYKANAAYQLPVWTTTLRASIGSAFKAPSLFQEFGPNSLPAPLGTLKPETATGWEAGFDTRPFDGFARLSVTYFDRRTTNLIGFISCFTPADAPGCPSRVAVFGYYDNIGKARGQGVETELTAAPTDDTTVTLGYTSMTARDTIAHLDLPRRPRDLASAVVTWRPLDGASLGLSATYQGKRFNDAGNFTPLSSTTRVNLFGSYDLSSRWQLFGRIDNVFNDRTEDVTGYGVPGLGAFGGLRVTL